MEYIEKFALPMKAGLKRDLLLTSIDLKPAYVYVGLKVVTYETVDDVDTVIQDYTYDTSFISINAYFNTVTEVMMSGDTLDVNNLPPDVVPVIDYLKSLTSYSEYVTTISAGVSKALDADLIKLTRN
jgi:hypothetical protein